jgi:hypothetical protein
MIQGRVSKIRKGQEWTQTFAYGVTPSSLTYSLNIANADDKVLEFAARPSVSTLVGELATFFNADIITGTPPGGSQLSVDAGVKMECRPLKIASNGCITLEITLTSSQLNGYIMSQGITDQLISVSKAKASTTVQVFPGQTVMVAGVKAETRVTADSSNPLLRSIPLVQYFFSNVQSLSDNRNLMYLVTPRLAGGKKNPLDSKNSPSFGPSAVAKKLDKGGLGWGSEYTALSYILKHIERSPVFSCFRSGDITLPFWGYEHTSLPHKLNQFSSFFYF